ncbi:hypothetical protein ADK49_04810 [Streptomyces sp. WM6349]|nr:hypothetical protein ADK49_04810 [Streptomyces sp. WM6349]KOV39849.1 hypothetical protein ADK98_30790 [Streptomyces sp. H036]
MPLRCGVYGGRSSTSTARASNAAVTVLDRKSLPRSTRTFSGSPPCGPNGSSRITAARSAARTDSRDGCPGVTATPMTVFDAQSTNQVTHGRRAAPSTSTRTGAWT